MKTGFYVTAIDGARRFYMRGPFVEHAAALAVVEETRNVADRLDPRSHFMAWGTARVEALKLPAARMSSYFVTCITDGAVNAA